MTVQNVMIMLVFILIVLIAGLIIKNRDKSSKISNELDSTHQSSTLPWNNGDLSNISEFIRENEVGQKLSLKRMNLNTNQNKKYREIQINGSDVTSRVLQGAVPILANIQTLGEISKQASHGLYTATVDPSTLSKFTDGTLTTMVREGGKLIRHSGFHEISLPTVNPFATINVAMQAMVMISGQYYLHQINSQLTQLGELVNFHHDEKTADLLTVQERLVKITQKSMNDSHDISELRNLLGDTRKVFNEYKIRLDREHSELIFFETSAWFAKDKIRDLETKANKMNLSYQMCFEADKLSLQVGLVEIAVRMKLGNQPDFINEQIKQFRSTYQDSFYHQSDGNLKELYKPINSKAKEFAKSAEQLKVIIDKPTQLINKLCSDNMIELSEQLILKFDEPKEILYIPNIDGKNERVFIAANDFDNLTF
nr:hypothetical protein [uncultured Trichococcus sp.]